MELFEKILGLPEFKVINVNKKYKDKIIIQVGAKCEKGMCPTCKKYSSTIHDRYEDLVRDISISGKIAYLKISKRVFFCFHCNKSFIERLNSVEIKHIYTKRYEKYIFENCLESSISAVSRIEKLPYDCIRGIYTRIGDICIEHLMKFNEDIEILGIDEISIRKGYQNFQAVVSNIGEGYVMEVLPDRKKETIVKYLKKLPRKAKIRIVFVSIDMWEGYLKATEEVLPNTTIVIDRFHVMKNLNASITRCRRNIQRKLPKKIRDKYKGYRWVLVKNEDNMSDEDIIKLKKMMVECPELKQLYNLKVEFQEIFERTRKAKVADKKLKRWERKVEGLHDIEMEKFLKLLNNWREWILNYFTSNKVTNAFVEGMNNKIKLLKRIGYGYRNKLNFRRRVLVECGYNNLSKNKKLIFLQ